eukprot:NODE_2532_length_1153_cov_45.826511_g2413_i0.p1 GENE.NODE_2532_length_1153_cov_45.826511_g2413_i0~~NODE_2532_length_1153_cov_45.826511_g2413_i0.p1  ORF type:complete len:329 (-),score=49.06 NODE_2532_length_1153_cov_45.826511_g2413_i0:109-1095(-)
MAQVIRKTVGAGRWFSADPTTLHATVQQCITSARPPPLPAAPIAVVAPHAGFAYSGAVAGHAFRALRDAYQSDPPQTVVILGFSHRGPFSGVALMDGDAVQSPLQTTPLDMEAADLLIAHGGGSIFRRYEPHNGEHSAENEIPFVQLALPSAKVLSSKPEALAFPGSTTRSTVVHEDRILAGRAAGVPQPGLLMIERTIALLVVALLGDHKPQTINALADALVRLAQTQRIVVVASTDMLHDPDYDKVTQTDHQTLKLLERMDGRQLEAQWSYDNQVLCGVTTVLTAIRFAQSMGATAGTVLKYRNCGDDFPDSRGSWVVGYGSVAFH